MKTRAFCGTQISEVGIGCWQLGGDWGPAIDRDKCFEILTAAVDNDISFFDTADVYGAGRSESLIGEFFKDKQSKPFIATKFGRGGDAYPDRYTEDVLRRSVEASLTRLDVDSLDLLQLHCIPTAVLNEGKIFEQLRKIKQEGLIKHFGASVETVEQGIYCAQQEGLSSLQVIINIFRQNALPELFPLAKKNGVGIIARLPLASGLLSGKFTQTTKFSEGDHRNFNRDGQCFNVGETFSGLTYEKGLELCEKLNTLKPGEVSLAEMSLRWILDQPAISTIIPGASSVQQVKNNAKASDLPSLPEETHQSLSAFYTDEVEAFIRGEY